MSEEIKVGEYVRTENGYIGYVENINDFREPSMKYGIDIQKADIIFVGEKNIKLHSPNIIDLIEVGDYVNGNIVYEVLDDEIELLSGKIKKKRIHFITGHLIDEDEIKSIVTHEQFREMEYKVNE